MRSLSISLLLVLLAFPAQAREISGELTYLARIALPPDAEMAIELRNPGGIVGEVRQATNGRQVPLPFTLSTEEGGELILRAALFSGGQAIWLSGPVPVPAGDAPLNIGQVELARHLSMGFATRMRCGEDVVEIGFIGDMARLRNGGRSFDLSPTPAASGARFSNREMPETVFWSRGNRALVRVEGALLAECQPMIPVGLLPFNARGNEPFWSVNVSREGLFLAQPEGKGTVESHPFTEPDADGDGLIFQTDSFALRITEDLCRDSMTGMPYPFQATLRRADGDWPGCAGDPASLLLGEWHVAALDDTALPPGTEVTLSFASGRISGKTGCNRVMGGFNLTGEGLSFGPLASTQMACPPDVMEIERRVLDALAQVTGFDFHDKDNLLLVGVAGTAVLSARR